MGRIERQIRNIVEAVKAGLSAAAMKDEMAALEERTARLVESTRDQIEEPPMLHGDDFKMSAKSSRPSGSPPIQCVRIPL